MGYSSWTSDSWDTFSTAKVSGKTATTIYTSTTMADEFDPKKMIRESRDSVDNPESNAIILGLDVTGSMDRVLESTMKGLNTLVTEIYDRKPVNNPQILTAGIGDAEVGDRCPLQVTQFESDIKIADQLSKIYFERGGGGNCYEGYAMLWYFAAMCTSIDCFEKRHKKGYLFTIGDEEPTPYLRSEDIKRVLDIDIQRSQISAEIVLEMVSRLYNVFHIVIEEGSHCRRNRETTISQWQNLLGNQRVICLSDHTKLAEVVVSTLQVCNGEDMTTVTKSWDGTTSLVVSSAIKNITSTTGVKDSDIVMF